MYEVTWLTNDYCDTGKAIVLDTDSLRDLILLLLKNKRYFNIKAEIDGGFKIATREEILSKISKSKRLQLKDSTLECYWLTRAFTPVIAKTTQSAQRQDLKCRDAF